jgi:hypothetical protein
MPQTSQPATIMSSRIAWYTALRDNDAKNTFPSLINTVNTIVSHELNCMQLKNRIAVCIDLKNSIYILF